MTIADESRILFIRLPAAAFLTTENLQIREMRKMSPAADKLRAIMARMIHPFNVIPPKNYLMI